MKKILFSSINKVDEFVSRSYIHLFKEKNALLTFLCHGIFNDINEIKQNVVDPQQALTPNLIRQFIEYFLEHAYTFVSPEDILMGLDSSKNYVLLTFDDGYYNNHLILPLLKEYKVPATFFISTNHIAQNKCFWWDVIYRERIKRDVSLRLIHKEYKALKLKRNEAIEQYITNTFGEKAFQPICDIDRPFSPFELSSFSKEPYVFLGNHTSNHAILTNYSESEIRAEMNLSQDYLFSITGITPNIISYPNGNYSEEILAITKEIGFKLGIAMNGHKNYLPIDLQGNDALLLNRFVLSGNRDIINLCESCRSDIQIITILKTLIKEKLGISVSGVRELPQGRG